MTLASSFPEPDWFTISAWIFVIALIGIRLLILGFMTSRPSAQ